MNCDYEQIGICDDGRRRYRCRRIECRHQRCSKYPPELLHRECGAAPPARPSFARKLKNFTVALVYHVCRRMPTCDQQQIDARLAICKVCPLFDAASGTCTHKDCGCTVANQPAFLNKLAWSDQQCPDDPPRWLRLDRPPAADPPAEQPPAS